MSEQETKTDSDKSENEAILESLGQVENGVKALKNAILEGHTSSDFLQRLTAHLQEVQQKNNEFANEVLQVIQDKAAEEIEVQSPDQQTTPPTPKEAEKPNEAVIQEIITAIRDRLERESQSGGNNRRFTAEHLIGIIPEIQRGLQNVLSGEKQPVRLRAVSTYYGPDADQVSSKSEDSKDAAQYWASVLDHLGKGYINVLIVDGVYDAQKSTSRYQLVIELSQLQVVETKVIKFSNPNRRQAVDLAAARVLTRMEEQNALKRLEGTNFTDFSSFIKNLQQVGELPLDPNDPEDTTGTVIADKLNGLWTKINFAHDGNTQGKWDWLMQRELKSVTDKYEIRRRATELFHQHPAAASLRRIENGEIKSMKVLLTELAKINKNLIKNVEGHDISALDMADELEDILREWNTLGKKKRTWGFGKRSLNEQELDQLLGSHGITKDYGIRKNAVMLLQKRG